MEAERRDERRHRLQRNNTTDGREKERERKRGQRENGGNGLKGTSDFSHSGPEGEEPQTAVFCSRSENAGLVQSAVVQSHRVEAGERADFLSLQPATAFFFFF
ncbi:hypothetical protein EYF80_061315 [Liparis tanakae]|uniref:Uncharacterized protein n=1 Tax=Liparis tanakae TaxID=230148 RepID=A0A4Z2EHW1_9TELE|nr:hypothetical protein EYF80_061315 [Liparis tanakae]